VGPLWGGGGGGGSAYGNVAAACANFCLRLPTRCHRPRRRTIQHSQGLRECPPESAHLTGHLAIMLLAEDASREAELTRRRPVAHRHEVRQQPISGRLARSRIWMSGRGANSARKGRLVRSLVAREPPPSPEGLIRRSWPFGRKNDLQETIQMLVDLQLDYEYIDTMPRCTKILASGRARYGTK
jgi:hypothetical protein